MLCEKCGIEHDGSYGSGRFCSQKCARSFSTSKNRDAINAKISIGLRNSDKLDHKYAQYLKNPKCCSICSKLLRASNKTGYCADCLRHAPELAEYRRKVCTFASSKVKNRKFWMTRDKKSYAEQFWTQVLDNNNISYKHNFPVKIHETKHYFYLDFYICKNDVRIDLEIDGKQHEYEDRKLHDISRDHYLTQQGFLIYRIKWNEINSEKGKLLMQSKIDAFLNFYAKCC